MKRRFLGQDTAHPDIANSLSNLALVYQHQGKLTEATSLLKESLEMNRQIHGQDTAHPDIARSMSNLADVFHQQGKLTEAAALVRKSLEMSRKVYGQDTAHPENACAACNSQPGGGCGSGEEGGESNTSSHCSFAAGSRAANVFTARYGIQSKRAMEGGVV